MDILYNKTEDGEFSVTLTRYEDDYFSNSKYDYYLHFHINYYNLIPNLIVTSQFDWHFASEDSSDWCSVTADLSYFENGKESIENFRYYKIYRLTNLQLADEQFESCEYREISLEYVDEQLVGNLNLEHSDEYYLNYLLSEGFKATTEFFENNNLKSLYRYTERIPRYYDAQ